MNSYTSKSSGRRTRNIFDPSSSEPFKLSRSKIENYVRCPRCFYLDRRLGIDQPSIPAFKLNSAVDTLFKKEFDIHRANGKAHPLMETYKINAIPYAHEDLDKWRENFVGVQYLHEPTNLLITGAVDDIWVNPEGELIVVDYKSTSKDGEISMDDKWKDSYKRQMEIYQWLLRQKGFKVSDVGYFVYANGRTDLEAFDGKLEFKITVHSHLGLSHWVEETLFAIKEALISDKLPAAKTDCEYCNYRRAAAQVEK